MCPEPPEPPDPTFGKSPKGARRKMIEIHLSQKICGARWCHFVKIRMPNLDAPSVYEFTDDFA